MSSLNDSPEKIGVLLMAYGSPESVDDLKAYLLDIRGGRVTPDALVEEIRERYVKIGGRSPLLKITRKQAEALEKNLNEGTDPNGTIFRVFTGMRHWEPRIKEAVANIKAEGIKIVVALVLAPHSSRLSTGAYFEKLQEAVDELGGWLEIRPIWSWHNHPGLIEAIAEKVQAAWDGFEDDKPFVVFTAHSLPARILSQDDPYDTQLRETCDLLAERLELPKQRWKFSYQSAGKSSEAWLGPAIDDVIVELAESGEKNILVVPVGFVSDHVEVLYDIDIASRNLAAEHNARLERSESLNDSPTFIETLADLVAIRLNMPDNLPASDAHLLYRA
jgi:ferrochelatase